MTTHDFSPSQTRPHTLQIHPGHLILAAFLLGVVAVVIGDGHQCTSDGVSDLANTILMAGVLAQVAALVLAFVRWIQRVPAAGGGLLGTILMTIVAAPAALVAAVAINGILCGW